MTTTNAIFSTDREGAEPTFPFPPRFRWLKRGTILVLLTIGSLALLRGWWGHVATERTREMVDAAHARREPILLGDFNPAPIPDGQNAAVTLGLAARSVYTDSQFEAFDNAWTGDTFSGADLAELRRIVALNGKVYQLCRTARSQTGVDWKLSLAHPALNSLLPHLNPQRNLANMQRWAILYDHATGNDSEAVERIRDILRQAEALNEGPSTLITHLVAIGIYALATNAIERITPDLRIDRRNIPRANSLPATSRQVWELIRDLLNEDVFRAATVRSWQGERMFALDLSEYIADGNRLWWTGFPSGKPMWLIGPMIRLDGMRIASHYTKTAAAAAKPDWPSLLASMPPDLRTSMSDVETMARCVSQMFSTSGDRVMRQDFLMLTERRAMAMELAIRLYRVEHDGKLPATLQELVPAYLPYLPTDPLAIGGRPMVYHPSATPPVFYSLGFDGIDDGGTSLPSTARGGYRWNAVDAVFPLETPALATQPSTQTQNNQ